MTQYIDFALIGELVNSYGYVKYEDLKNLPSYNEAEIAAIYGAERNFLLVDREFMQRLMNKKKFNFRRFFNKGVKE